MAHDRFTIDAAGTLKNGVVTWIKGGKSMTTIAKGTTVRVTTTNGGDITGVLTEDHNLTYDNAVIRVKGYNNSTYVTAILFYRIKTIEAVEA